MERSRYSVYGLQDPLTDKIRYVGRTIRFKGRCREHINNKGNKNGCYEKRSWIKDLEKINTFPRMILLKECNDYGDACLFEYKFIQRFNALGYDLFNKFGTKPEPKRIKIKRQKDGKISFIFDSPLAIGESLKKIRITKGLSLVKAGKLHNVAWQSVRQWEAGMNVSVNNLEKICERYGRKLKLEIDGVEV